MSILVVRPGSLATVQDLGRSGLQHLAIVPGGAMDVVSHRIANALVGNFSDLATLEFALAGPELVLEHETLIALHGARFEPVLDGLPMPSSRPVLVPAGARLKVGPARKGAFGYLAVAGGIDVAPVLGSRSTHLAAGFGGWQGRAVPAGAKLPLARDAAARARARFARLVSHANGARDASRRGTSREEGAASGTARQAASVAWFAPALTLSAADPVPLRFIAGAHMALFDEASRSAFTGAPWRVAAESSRMGYRLSGPKLALAATREIASQAVCFGTVQVPAGGQPIVLMADRQTTGGYPRFAEVIAADLPRLAQCAPGSASVRFEPVTLEEADRAREELARRVAAIIVSLRGEYGNEVD